FTDTATIAAKTGLEPRAVRRLLLSAREKLFAQREQRVRPGRDEKILTSWNALMIRGMARAGRLLDRTDWLDSAHRALEHLQRLHWRDGRLLATSRDGMARLDAYLDDHVYLIDAILELLQAHWDSELYAFAATLADRVLDGFEDREAGGFFFTASDHEALLHRPRPLADDALPSGNGVAIEVLQRLSQLGGDLRYQDAATRALRAAQTALQRAPYAHVGMLEGLRLWLQPPTQVVIRGDDAAGSDWREALDQGLGPYDSVYRITSDTPRLPPALAAMQAAEASTPTSTLASTLAFVCRGHACAPPADNADALKFLLSRE
ncbi:MAG: thioredoxin domain-containing protein, partial [Gammaproteobacteria bacterium]|nr:thioredoxin domain-containing protein [Gammaproteobacteria bacterium]